MPGSGLPVASVVIGRDRRDGRGGAPDGAASDRAAVFDQAPARGVAQPAITSATASVRRSAIPAPIANTLHLFFLQAIPDFRGTKWTASRMRRSTTASGLVDDDEAWPPFADCVGAHDAAPTASCAIQGIRAPPRRRPAAMMPA